MSNITKHALAESLKKLLLKKPLNKITINDLTTDCGISRMAFYYHFKDKYDLVNWIFDTDFISLAALEPAPGSAPERWDLIETICDYFYDNRAFYRKALQITGQNSFSDHFTEYIGPSLKSRLACLLGDEQVDEFFIDFFTDAVLCAMKRWLLAKDCMPSKQFVAKIRTLIQSGATVVYQEIEQQ